MHDSSLASRRECMDVVDAPSETCSVLVSSCDAYSDLWTPFFNLFWRNWPDCPYRVYLGTNWAHHDDQRVRTLNAGDDESWSKNLRFFLNQIGSEYVLLLLEDFFLTRRVSTEAVAKNVSALRALNGTALRLFPNPPPDNRVDGYESIGSIHRFAPFRVSAQAGIWKRESLLALLRDEENAWEFERKATVRSRGSASGFYCTLQPILPYVHVVEQGRWFWHAARRFRKANIGCNFETRAIIPAWTAAKKTARSMVQGVANRLRNWRLRTQTGGEACHGSRS